MMPENGQLSVPPGFRFHPTDEELLYYYLRKKVSYEAIDLDVIREVDLNKLEPWDLKDKCRIGSRPQDEWYFFSHKDKKYPTGTRTNRATTAGFWKATGRDKAIYLQSSSKRIGMRKTLVFYTGRAPHGQKTDWIMHEYRLEDDDPQLQQEDGWVVCRVFKKKNHGRGFQSRDSEPDDVYTHLPYAKPTTLSAPITLKQPCFTQDFSSGYNGFDGSMHLPQLSNPDATFLTTTMGLGSSQSFLRLTSTGDAGGGSNVDAGVGLSIQQGTERLSAAGGSDWSFLDKLLLGYRGLDPHPQQPHNKSHQAPPPPPPPQVTDMVGTSGSHLKFPFQYLGCESDFMKQP